VLVRGFPWVAVLLLFVPALSGCADLSGLFGGTDYQVRATALAKPPAWNRDGRFEVQVSPPALIEVHASASDGRVVDRSGESGVVLELEDGTWDLSYKVAGRRWASFEGVRIDTTPPSIEGLRLVDNAPSGDYTLGQGARITGASFVTVTDLADGHTVANALPVHLTGLGDGLRLFLVSARDEAGNVQNATVQVRVGSAVDLPPGAYTFGVVARYTNQVQLWDLRDPKAYLGRAEAARAASGYLGAGYGITPSDPAVKQVVAQVVEPDMNTMEAALALFRWMADNLEYDESRLDSDHLLLPRQVLGDTEDPAGTDCADPEGGAEECDGLVADGAGNQVKGGICRDLAATYVSLLRAAGVPARLVSGYVGGEVNGFHAWVEFYAGSLGGQDPWVPVDVSPIDGRLRDAVLMQAFGIRLPDYLPLRPIPPDAEQPGWSTALSVSYRWPQASASPDVRFEKSVSDDASIAGYLCFNPTTRARAASEHDRCDEAYTHYIDRFLLRSQRTIDYGVQVVRAARGTQVTAEVAFPFPDQVAPSQVDYQFYGKPFTTDNQAGKAESVFTV
jgi:transglutaminase-like putative cysteine protease